MLRELVLMKWPNKEDAFVGRLMKRQIGESAQQLQVVLQRVESPA